jgi:predicted DNA binding CopG/RHH family protein
MLKKFPVLKTDEEAEHFIETADLSEYDFSGFVQFSSKFEFAAKDERINMRLPSSLLGAVKAKAKEAGMPYQRFIRATLEKAVRGE